MLPRDQFDANGQRVFDMINGKDQALPRMGPQATSMYSIGVAEPMDNLNQYLRKTVVGSHYFEISALIAAREFDQQYEWTGHEAGALRAGVDSFTDHGEDPSVTVGRITEALERGLLTPADVDRAVRRLLLLRLRLGEFDPDLDPYADTGAGAADVLRSARERLRT